MKVGLIDVDSHRWPNLCLMKLAAYHKARGDTVEWWSSEGHYDLVYKSRVFTDLYSKDTITVSNADEVFCGGTGYGPGPNLPDVVEHSRPDCSIYPQFSDTAYGFLTRGCPRNCPCASSPERRETGASRTLISSSFGTVRGTSSCWTQTCWPAKITKSC